MRLLPALLTIALLAGCSVVQTPRTLRGNKVDPDQLKQLVVGTSTRADATTLLGSPTARATFNDNEWIYISETTRVRVGRTPGVLAQDVTVLTFDNNGVLQGIKQLNQGDSRQVAVVDRATPSPGSEATFMQQLLGNVGRFSASPGGNRTSSPGGGVGSSRSASDAGL